MQEACFALGYRGSPSSVRLLEKFSHTRLRKANRYIVSGISGSGKTTFGKLLEYMSFRKLPTAVVRSPRPGEIQGLDYIFLDEYTFERWRDRNMFSFYHKTNGVSHGFLRSHLRDLKGQSGRFYLDKSIRSVSWLFPRIRERCTLIYLLPPTFDELYFRIKKRERLRQHAGLADEEIVGRFREEIEEFRQSVSLPYAYFVNDDIKTLLNLMSCV